MSENGSILALSSAIFSASLGSLVLEVKYFSNRPRRETATLSLAVEYGRYNQKPYPSVGFRYLEPSYRPGVIAPCQQFLLDPFPVCLQIGFHNLNSHSVDSGGSFVPQYLPVGILRDSPLRGLQEV